MTDVFKNKRVKLKFSLRDDFGNYYKYKSDEKLDPDYECLDIFYLIKAFKKFLINAGFTVNLVNCITYKDISEDNEEDIAI